MPLFITMDEILIGKVVTVVGIKGEIKIYNYSDSDRYKSLKHIYLKENNKLKEYHITNSRVKGDTVILGLKEVLDRNQALLLVGFDVYILENDLRELPKNTYYIRDLIGCEIIDSKDNSSLGIVKDVLQYTPQDNFEVELNNGEITYIPHIKEFVREVDIKNKKIYINVIPGLLGDAIEV